jgi:HD-GYP domain-containing protein (c-di-GMP phosphodiesterase class II)
VNRVAKTVIAVTLGISAIALAAAIILATQSNTPKLALWLGLLLAGAAMELATVAGDEEESEHPFSLASSFHLLSAIVLPPGWAALIAGGSTALGETVRRRAPVRVLFNAGVAVTSTLIASSAFHRFVPVEDAGQFGWSIYPAFLVMLVVYVVITVSAVEAVITALAHHRWDLVSWAKPSELLAFLMEGCVAVVLAVLINSAPKVLAFSVLILVAVFLSMKHNRSLKRETRQTLRALAAAVDARDPYTAKHSERVGLIASRLAESLDLPSRQVSATRWAGRLHDLGKIVVDNAILHKDGPLDDRQWKLMRSHPEVAAELLEPLSLTRNLGPAIRYHHERPDGQGYYKVGGDELPLEACMIALADAYDAMTTDRPYRKALTPEEALSRIEAGLGTQFHRKLGIAFLAMMRGQSIPEVELPRQSRRPSWLPSLNRRPAAVEEDLIDRITEWPTEANLPEGRDRIVVPPEPPQTVVP